MNQFQPAKNWTGDPLYIRNTYISLCIAITDLEHFKKIIEVCKLETKES